MAVALGHDLVFLILVLGIALSAFIKYPDIVKSNLKIYSSDAAKPAVVKLPGKLVKLLVHENDDVKAGQPLAFIESTANHQAIINLLTDLKQIQQDVLHEKAINSALGKYQDLQLGELQSGYQAFSQALLNYSSSIEDGFYLRKKEYLKKELTDINRQKTQLQQQKNLQNKDLALASDEYNMHRKLAEEKVETSAELRQQESKFIGKKAPLVQTDASLISANSTYLSKEKELLELDNQIMEDRSIFLQALNSLISQAEDWKSKYVLTASQDGRVSFAGIVQQNQVLVAGQEVFYINPGNEKFFGEMPIPQDNMGKVKEGQEVLIKLRSFPFEEYGMLRGKIAHIAEVPYRDSVFISRVEIIKTDTTDKKRPIRLKQGMEAGAEIVTQDATILQRISRNVIKAINSR
jgi:multidrug resistance efflux pump